MRSRPQPGTAVFRAGFAAHARGQAEGRKERGPWGWLRTALPPFRSAIRVEPLHNGADDRQR